MGTLDGSDVRKYSCIAVYLYCRSLQYSLMGLPQEPGFSHNDLVYEIRGKGPIK